MLITKYIESWTRQHKCIPSCLDWVQMIKLSLVVPRDAKAGHVLKLSWVNVRFHMEMEWKWVINKQDSKVLALPFTTHKPHPKEYGVGKEIKTKMSHWEQLGEKFQMIRQYKDQSDLYINSRTFAVSTLPVPREFKGTLMRFIDVKVAWTSREQIIPNPPRTPTAVGYNSSKYGKTHVLFEMGVMRKVWRDITSWGEGQDFGV